jgi:acid phosphatase
VRDALALSCAGLCAAAAAGSTAGATRATPVPRFSRVVLIVFENKGKDAVVGNPTAPTFARLSRRYATLTNYRAVAHPSLPNYLALVSGSTQGIVDDCGTCVVSARNLADTLEEAGKTWKTYAEGLPRPGFTGTFAGRYARKHDPFLYFKDVLVSRTRRERVVPLSAFAADLAARRLPSFSLVVPDLCHDMHDCSVAKGDSWLASFLPPLLTSGVLRGGALFVVFDESDNSSVGGGGVVPAYVAGPLVRAGSQTNVVLDHYSLLRTIEDGLGLPPLGLSASATPIGGIWR